MARGGGKRMRTSGPLTPENQTTEQREQPNHRLLVPLDNGYGIEPVPDLPKFRQRPAMTEASTDGRGNVPSSFGDCEVVNFFHEREIARALQICPAELAQVHSLTRKRAAAIERTKQQQSCHRTVTLVAGAAVVEVPLSPSRLGGYPAPTGS